MRVASPVDIRIAITDKQTVPMKARRKTRGPSRRKLLVIGLLFLCLAGSTSALASYLLYRMYTSDLSLARTGMQHLRSAASLLEALQSQPFALKTVQLAQQEFASALSDTQALNASLVKFSGIAGAIPVYGPPLTAAIHLSTMASDVSQAGLSGCSILSTVLSRLGSPLSVSTHGLTGADFTTISNEYRTLDNSLNAAMDEALQVQPDDTSSFDSRLPKLLREFQANIPMIRTGLAVGSQALPALPALLGIGTPSHFLLEIMDSTELRPAGGFIGNYGIAMFDGGRLASARIRDVYLLDKAYQFAGNTIPYPAAYSWFSHYLAHNSWSLRDSNLDADFPTAAQYGEANFEREGGNAPLQGVIALTPAFIEGVLNITGPISVPEYQETVTAQNLVSLIHFHQLEQGESGLLPSPDGQTSQRKYFTELLGERLLARVQQLPSADVAKVFKLALDSLHTKDVQVYVNADSVENALRLLHLDGSIQSPPGDHLFVVDANVGGNKANSLIVNSIHDLVSIDVHGNAAHTTIITYAWTIPGQYYGNSLYKDYVRVYVPAGSTLVSQQGWQPLGTSSAFGSQVWAGFFTLSEGQILTITLKWTNHGASESNASGWRYQYLLQRQAGMQRNVAVQVMLPLCATVTNQWGGLRAGKKQEEALVQPLTQDTTIGVDYACKS